MKDSSLKTEIASLKLENPHILASGILDENGYTMKKILEEGAAAVVTKSIGMDERKGYQAPVIADAPEIYESMRSSTLRGRDITVISKYLLNS